METQNNAFNKSYNITRNYRILFPLIISITSFLTYLNAVTNQFAYDDFTVIVNNSFIKDFKYFPALFNQNYFDISKELSYRPLVTLSYFIDNAIWQHTPLGFHLTNLLIHTLNTTLIFFFILKITHNIKLAIISCLLFTSHPILTESVNSAGFREDLLCTTFFITSLLLYGKLHTSKRKNIFYIITLITYCLSLLSKELAISLPLIIFVMDILLPQSEIKLKTRILKYYSGFVLVSVIYISTRLFFLRSGIENITYPGNSIAINILTMSKVIASYVKLLFFPVTLNPDYHVTLESSLISQTFLLSLASLICITIIIYKLFRKQKNTAFPILWVFITLVPVMNIVPIGNIMAERYLYLPSIGFCIFLGIVILKIQRSLANNYRYISIICLLTLLLFYFSSTIKHNRKWYDDMTLWTYTISNTSCGFTTHNNIGKEYLKKGFIDKAIDEFNIAITKASEVRYAYPIAHYNLGIAYDEKGMYDASIQEYRNALRIDPKNADTHNNLAITLFKNGHVTAAIEELNKAITLNPNDSRYHFNLAKIYNEINMFEKARIEQEIANHIEEAN